MKIDLEAMAREAGFGNVVSMPHLKGFEAFARLIVERCAVEAEAVEDKQRHIGACPESAWEQGTLDAAEAIRSLLED